MAVQEFQVAMKLSRDGDTKEDKGIIKFETKERAEEYFIEMENSNKLQMETNSNFSFVMELREINYDGNLILLKRVQEGKMSVAGQQFCTYDFNFLNF